MDSKDRLEMISLNFDALDVEELERRLELAMDNDTGDGGGGGGGSCSSYTTSCTNNTNCYINFG